MPRRASFAQSRTDGNDIRPFHPLCQKLPCSEQRFRNRLLYNRSVFRRRKHLHHARTSPVSGSCRQHRRTGHIHASRHQKHLPESSLVPSAVPLRHQCLRILVISVHLRNFPVKASLGNANLRRNHLPGISASRIQHQPPFTESESNRFIRLYRTSQDFPGIGINPAGKVQRKLPPFQTVKNAHGLPEFPRHLPGKPHTKQRVHQNRIRRPRGFFRKRHRIISQNRHLLLPLPGSPLSISHTPDFHLISLFGQKPRYSQPVSAVVARPCHDEYGFSGILPCTIPFCRFRRRKGSPLHQHTGRNTDFFYCIVVIPPHLGRRHQIFHFICTLLPLYLPFAQPCQCFFGFGSHPLSGCSLLSGIRMLLVWIILQIKYVNHLRAEHIMHIGINRMVPLFHFLLSDQLLL